MSDTPNSPDELFRIFFRNTPRRITYQQQADVGRQKFDQIEHLEDEVVIEMKAKEVKVLFKLLYCNARALDQIMKTIDQDSLDDL